MNPWLDIIIPSGATDGLVASTVASLLAQTDRDFTVLLSECSNHSGISDIDEPERNLRAAGIAVRRLHAPFSLLPIEHWNWAHSQATAGWLKMLLPGEQLKPAYVARLKDRVNARPDARMIRCDAEVQADWGSRTFAAPFQNERVSPAEFLYHFPREINWINASANIAYSREAWRSIGGFARHLPGTARLNLNVILALHYGLENIPETLVTLYSSPESNVRLFNVAGEMWLILRQVQNYCLAANLPWSRSRALPAALAAALRYG